MHHHDLAKDSRRITRGKGEVGTERPVRHDRLGSWSVRLSAEYHVTTDDGIPDGYVRIRLDETAEDKLAGYNRPEHLRAFPETDPLYIDVQKPLRASAESANRYLDDHTPGNDSTTTVSNGTI